jgi:hypothetical protein
MSGEVTLLYAKGQAGDEADAAANSEADTDVDTNVTTAEEDGGNGVGGGNGREDASGDEEDTEEIRFTITNLDTGEKNEVKIDEKVTIDDWEGYYTAKFDTFCKGDLEEDAGAEGVGKAEVEEGNTEEQQAEGVEEKKGKEKPKPRSPSRAETQLSIATPACSMWGFAFKNGPVCVSDRNAVMSEVDEDDDEEGIKRKATRSGEKSNYWKFLFGNGDNDDDGTTNKLATEDDAAGAGGVKAVSISIDDFELLQVLGRGGYGKVMLVQRKLDGDLFAVKMIRKAQMTWQDRRNCVIERSILAMNNHPFISRCHLHLYTALFLAF